MIRQIPAGARLTEEVKLEALGQAVALETIRAVVSDLGVSEKRQRKLSAETTVLLAIAMNLFTHQSLGQVLVKMLNGLRFVWPGDLQVASKGAISQARYRLGARPLVELFHRVCQPLATPGTQGAFLFGRRLMALDITVEDVPDTPENARAFGKHPGPRGESAFPKVMAVYLAECGTHAIVEAGFWPGNSDQHASAQRLLRSLTAEMLITWDSGLHSFEIAQKTRARGADFLGRVPAGAKFRPVLALADGSYLAYIYPDDRRRRQRGEHLLVRVIEYTLTDPNRVGYNQLHRLMTSLLDQTECPALELVLAYHERWEIELTIDELDTHQRPAISPLRSKKPVGVIQEFYGLLIAHYTIRTVIHQAAQKHNLDPDRISFVNATELVCDAISDFQRTAPSEHPRLYQRLLDDVAHYRLPERLNRVNPRVVKRKMSNFRRKRPEHKHWPQPTKPFRDAVTVLRVAQP